MLKRFFILLLLFTTPVFAGDLETSLDRGDNVFLYIYTPECKHCVKFQSKYTTLSKAYNGKYSFIKINGNTPYGVNLMNQIGYPYVPLVVLINSKKNKIEHLNPYCLANDNCIKYEMDKFRL